MKKASALLCGVHRDVADTVEYRVVTLGSDAGEIQVEACCLHSAFRFAATELFGAKRYSGDAKSLYLIDVKK